jgi:hypothetical protein
VVTRAAHKLSDLKQFADRGPSLTVDNGWRGVADHTLAGSPTRASTRPPGSGPPCGGDRAHRVDPGDGSRTQPG